MLSMLGENFSKQQFEIFVLNFFHKIGFESSCKLSLRRKRQSIFSEKKKKKKKNNNKTVSLSYAEYAQRVRCCKKVIVLVHVHVCHDL